MTPPPEALPATISTDALLEEAAWLRRLAARLVRDHARAEDAVQETLVAAWSRRREGRVPGRRWLGTVLRNRVRDSHRAGARRSRREDLQAPGHEHVPATDDALDRVEVHRRLVEAVDALDEPYRTVIALRFLEGLAPRQIAKRTGVPVKTVHTRIDRALARLRERLDARFGGDGRAWAVALGGLGAPPVLGTTSLGALAMGTVWKWAAAASGVLVVGVAVHRVTSESPAPAPVAAAAANEPETNELATPVVPERVEPRREVVATPEPAPESVASTPDVVPETFEGRVVDPIGRAVPGATVLFVDRHDDRSRPWKELALGPATRDGADTTRTATSDPDGVFHLPVQPTGGRLLAYGAGLATLASPGVTVMPPPEPPVIVVAPERSWAGVVRDETGRELADVRIDVLLPSDVAARLRPGIFGRGTPSRTERTDGEGRFELPRLGFVDGMTLRTSCDGFETASTTLPATSVSDLEIVLERALGSGALAGVVVGPTGGPVAGALVSTGTVSTRTDAAGEFVLAAAQADGAELRAVATGHLPARVRVADLRPEERTSVLLVLGGDPLAISGRVVDASGAPVPDALVWSWDTERFGQIVEPVGGLDFLLDMETESLLTERNARGCLTRTDADGRFRLEGLRDTDYGLWCLDARTLASGWTDAVRAGSTRVVLATRAEDAGPVAGRVTSYAGQALAGVEVRAGRRVEDRNGRARYLSTSDTPAVTVTDERGEFRFGSLSLVESYLNASHDGSDVRFELSDAVDPTAIELRVPQRCHLRVTVVSRPEEARHVQLLDEHDDAMMISTSAGTMRLAAQLMPVEDGRTDLITTTEAARTLVLFGNDGGELLRIPIELLPGDVNELTL